MKVLLIKLTSMGDLIHALPALSDAMDALPGIRFDWVIDEHFQEVAKWHPAVDQIFITDHRKWRRGLLKRETRGALSSLIRCLRENEYDLVIDGQGNFKTALFSLFMKGMRAGFDARSVREAVAHLAYQKKVSASWKIHAVERLRRLFSGSLGYPYPKGSPDFRIDRSKFKKPALDLPQNYLLFVPNAGWETKQWPEGHWARLIELIDPWKILIPSGNEGERARAERLSAGSSRVMALPRMSLSEVAYIAERASASVSMDTGLSHLAAALEVSQVTVYGPTDPYLVGTHGEGQAHLQSELPCAPCQKKKCRIDPAGDPPCMKGITPEAVFLKLDFVLRASHICKMS